MRIMAGNTGSGSERSMDEAALVLVLSVTFKAKRFRQLHKLRRPSFSGDFVAKFAKILFCQQTIHF
jgi:hypothetical protein